MRQRLWCWEAYLGKPRLSGAFTFFIFSSSALRKVNGKTSYECIYSVYECQFTLDKLKQSSEMEKSTALGARQVKEEDDTEKEIVDSSADKIIDLAVVKTEDTLSKDCNQNIIITPSIQTNSNKGDSLKKESKRQKAKSMPHGIMRAKHPWFTEEFIALLKQREALNCSLKMNPDNIELRREFSLVRNRASSVRKKLKRQYQVYLEEL